MSLSQVDSRRPKERDQRGNRSSRGAARPGPRRRHVGTGTNCLSPRHTPAAERPATTHHPRRRRRQVVDPRGSPETLRATRPRPQASPRTPWTATLDNDRLPGTPSSADRNGKSTESSTQRNPPSRLPKDAQTTTSARGVDDRIRAPARGAAATNRAAMARVSAALLLWCLSGAAAKSFYVCNEDVGDRTFLGAYELDAAGHAGKSSWTNENDRTIFAHGPFFYLGARPGGYRTSRLCMRRGDRRGYDSDRPRRGLPRRRVAAGVVRGRQSRRGAAWSGRVPLKELGVERACSSERPVKAAVAAAASPRLVSTEYPRLGRGVAATASARIRVATCS